MLLRNGWYTENYTAGVPGSLAHGRVHELAGGDVSSCCSWTGTLTSPSDKEYKEVLSCEN